MGIAEERCLPCLEYIEILWYSYKINIITVLSAEMMNRKILVIEDDKDIARLLETYLGDYGHEVQGSASQWQPHGCPERA